MDADAETDDDRHSQILDKISASPYDYEAHQQFLASCKSQGSVELVQQAWELRQRFFPLGVESWLEWIQDYKAESSSSAAILGLYERAIGDLLSYADYVLDGYCRAWGTQKFADEEDDEEESPALSPDTELQSTFTEEYVRELLENISTRAIQDLYNGQRVWKLRRNFEFYIYKNASDKQGQRDRIYNMLQQRIAQPHNGMQETFQDFSTFISENYSQNDYEDHMIAANELYSTAKQIYDRREPFELALIKENHSVQSYLAYIAYEKTGKKATFAGAFNLTSNLFERAIASSAANRSDWQLWSDFIQLWRDRVNSILQQELGQDATEDDEELRGQELISAGQGFLDAADRAAKNMPYFPESWATLMRAQERLGQPELVESTFQQARSSNLFQKSVEGLVTLYIARADFQRRTFESVVEVGEEAPEYLVDIVDVIDEGIEEVRKASKEGDLQFRLEKYATRTLERFSRLDEAEAMWQKATTLHKHSVWAWSGYSDFEIRRNDIEGARTVFQQAAKQRLDSPEWLYDAWTTFEHQHGSVVELEAALSEVQGRLRAINAKRAQQAEYEAQQAATNQTNEATPMEVEVSTADSKPAKKKRAAEDTPSEAGDERETKRSKTVHEAPVIVKRDRENATVLVAHLPENAEEEDLHKLFRDCGEIREVTLFSGEGLNKIGTVEFQTKDSIPAALTKDKKRINEEEISVESAWRATLFINNYPETYDKEQMQALFSIYGRILDLRWPSKRHKSTRRFCYIQFDSSKAAQNALEQHGKELAPGVKLSVQISDPTRKKERTDVNANKKEIHVGGLAKSATELDLNKLFERFGKIIGIRVAMTDDKSGCRGFAFVDFETEDAAQAALALNSTEYKKRNISVTIADARQAGTQARSKQSEGPNRNLEEALAKSVKISKLPADCQEEHIRQAFEKHEKVAKIIFNMEKLEATVEFESAAILLLPEDSILVEGSQVKISPAASLPVTSNSSNGQTSTKSETSALDAFKPRVFTKRGGGPSRGRGRGKRGLGA